MLWDKTAKGEMPLSLFAALENVFTFYFSLTL